MAFYRTLKFLNYYFFSRHGRGHGIHSPFVFDLISRVFRNKTDPDIVLKIENIRKKHLSDKTLIEVLDLGSGSKANKCALRSISEIAKYSAVPMKYGILLSNLAREFGKPGIIEFGTSLGISAMYLASGSPGSPVFTMEGCPSLSAIASFNFREGGFDSIKMMTGEFEELIPELKDNAACPGLVFIDGNHRKGPVKRYFKEMTEISRDDTVIVIDDIHLSAEMEEVWEEIKQSENVSFTIDLFRMGVVFFRKGMSRSDYVVRY